MDLELFEKEMARNDVPTTVDWDKVDKGIHLSIDKRVEAGLPWGHKNLINVSSELAELNVALTKYMLGERSINLLEEIADVACALRYLCIIAGIREEKMAKAVNVKMQREIKRIATSDEDRKLLLYPVE